MTQRQTILREDVRSRNDRLRGFTLIELLVVIVIIVILASLTLAAIRATTGGDRIRGGARQTQSALQGTMVRALREDNLIGLRLLLDENDPTTVRTMIYVEQLDPWRQGEFLLRRDSTGNFRYVVGNTGANPTRWDELRDQGLLPDVTRIKIPADDTGKWLFVDTRQSGSSGTNPGDLLIVTPVMDGELAGVMLDPGSPGGDDSFPLTANVNNIGNYILETGVGPLPNEEPLQLPNGCVIDLDNSFLPSSWYEWQEVAAPFVSTDPLYIAGWRETGLPPATGGNVIIRRYAPLVDPANPRHLDILFSPRGVVAGPLAATGKIHLVLAEIEDTLRNLYPEHADTEGEHLIMSLFPQTGGVSVHPLFEFVLNDPAVPDNSRLRFNYAETGEVAGK